MGGVRFEDLVAGAHPATLRETEFRGQVRSQTEFENEGERGGQRAESLRSAAARLRNCIFPAQPGVARRPS